LFWCKSLVWFVGCEIHGWDWFMCNSAIGPACELLSGYRVRQWPIMCVLKPIILLACDLYSRCFCVWHSPFLSRWLSSRRRERRGPRRAELLVGAERAARRRPPPQGGEIGDEGRPCRGGITSVVKTDKFMRFCSPCVWLCDSLGFGLICVFKSIAFVLLCCRHWSRGPRLTSVPRRHKYSLRKLVRAPLVFRLVICLCLCFRILVSEDPSVLCLCLYWIMLCHFDLSVFVHISGT